MSGDLEGLRDLERQRNVEAIWKVVGIGNCKSIDLCV